MDESSGASDQQNTCIVCLQGFFSEAGEQTGLRWNQVAQVYLENRRFNRWWR